MSDNAKPSWMPDEDTILKEIIADYEDMDCMGVERLIEVSGFKAQIEALEWVRSHPLGIDSIAALVVRYKDRLAALEAEHE